MESSVEFSLIVPTLNEKESIIEFLGHLQDILYKSSGSYEILVVDDNSPDGTGQLVEQYGQSHPQVRLLRRLTSQGVSVAVMNGFEEARGQYMATIDADFSHDARILPQMLEAAREGYEVVVGSRRVPGGGTDHWPWYRKLFSATATGFARAWFNLPVKDPVSGYFLVNRTFFNKVRPRLNPVGYNKILLEILVKTKTSAVKEIPFIFHDRRYGSSKLNTHIAYKYVEMIWGLRAYASFFDWLRRTHHTGRYSKVKAMLKEGSLLDIGCGRPCECMPDQAFLRFANRASSAGVDLNPIEGPYPFFKADIRSLPFEGTSFNNVVAMEVLEHVENPEVALKEIKRVLKKDGFFIMSTPDSTWLWDRIWDMWSGSVGKMWEHQHVTELCAKEWRALLETEFDVVRLKRHWYFDLVFLCRPKSRT